MNSPTSYLEEVNIKPANMLMFGVCRDCKTILNIGIFFDGTDNSVYTDEMHGGHSNIARLYAAYREDPEKGYFRYYIQGVGTAFKEIGEDVSPFTGGPWGRGGEARIIYALLQVFNSMYRFVGDDKSIFGMHEIKALSSEITVNGSIPNEYPPQVTFETDALTKMKMTSGLVGEWDLRNKFFRERADKLRKYIECKKKIPNISGVYFDVFGFSRGASQARVFCTWLHESMLINEKICGVPAYVRMLGLFDTVASVGFSKTGHSSWATAENLRINENIKKCVHYVALHEFRNNFPLDSVCVNGILPPNCCEQLGIGSHSDIGGGYEPGEQGKGVLLNPDPSDPRLQCVSIGEKAKGERNKLSQLPLNLMLDAARKSRENHGADGDPWIDFRSSVGDERRLVAQFECDKTVRIDVCNYFSKCGVVPGLPVDLALQEHGAVYLAWRYAVSARKRGFLELPSVKYAQVMDSSGIKYYIQGEQYFASQISQVQRMVDGVAGFKKANKDDYSKIGFHQKAGDIYKKIICMAVSNDIGVFFDMYVHDSYAGFIKKFKDGLINNMTHRIAEPKLYLTYRGMYQGSDVKLNAQQEEQELREKVSATA